LSTFIRRAVVAGAVTAVGSLGAAVPALAADAPVPCDPAVTMALETAQANAKAAQKAFTTFKKGSPVAEVERFKNQQIREAKTADKKADRLEERALKADKATRAQARAAARAAREAARAEAKEAKAVQRASRDELRALAKVEKKRLKAEWDAAKAALKDAHVAAGDCGDPEGDEPTEPTEPTE
jgi:hypothetical protein